MDKELFGLAEEFRQKREIRDLVKEQLAELNDELKQAQTALTDAMAAAECPSFTHGDKAFSLTCTKRYSAATERKEELYATLREQGYEHLFTVNAQTLGSFVKEQADEETGELPDWLCGLVNSYDDIGIQMRKATKKT
jgi:hypothetical protein